MTSQISWSRWTVFALFPALALACSTDPDSTYAEETDTGEFTQFRDLTESHFEIDDNANLLRDVDPPALDWASIVETRLDQEDGPSGQNDSSYGGGVKEDIACPAIGTGSIPNNKSDLKWFGAWREPGPPGSAGYLHLFWTRVQDPSGTTLMDFEFNQSDVKCDPQNVDHPHKRRTNGDLLLEYRLEQGGAFATIKKREWTGNKWGPADNLSAAQARGTINTSLIAPANADGLGQLDPRTFGEASIDLDAIFDDEGSCVSFGSAFVKSRSSDSFTSALKDFTTHIDINISNCGQVTIRKETNPDGLVDVPFNFSHTLQSDPPPDNPLSFTLRDGQSETFANVLFGNGYKVEEVDLPLGFDLKEIDCDVPSHPSSDDVMINIDESMRRVTFDIDHESDIVDCTFINERVGGAIKIKKTRSHAAAGSGDHPHENVRFLVNGGDVVDSEVVTNSQGEACIGGLPLGFYTVEEILPPGYRAQGDLEKIVEVTGAAECPNGGDEVEFHNTPLTDITMSVGSQIDGGTSSSIICEPVNPPGEAVNGATESNGDGSLTLPDLLPGTYACEVVINPW
jgi:hypothetical protein